MRFLLQGMKFDCKKGLERPINAAINHNTVYTSVRAASANMLFVERISRFHSLTHSLGMTTITPGENFFEAHGFFC